MHSASGRQSLLLPPLLFLSHLLPVQFQGRSLAFLPAPAALDVFCALWLPEVCIF